MVKTDRENEKMRRVLRVWRKDAFSTTGFTL
jgi:hypothetical protein